MKSTGDEHHPEKKITDKIRVNHKSPRINGLSGNFQPRAI